MATRMVFFDNDNNELSCYLNDNGKVSIDFTMQEVVVDHIGYIELDKSDVLKLINLLTEIEKEMAD